MKEKAKRIVAVILMLVTCWTGTVYATEIDGLYRGYFLGDIFIQSLEVKERQ